MKDRGIVFLLSGPRHSELLATCLWSLRKHCDLPASIFCTEAMRPICERLQDDKRLGIASLELIALTTKRHGSYVAKAQLSCRSPYVQTAYLDADMVVCGQIDELFAAPMTVTEYLKWTATGRIVGGRLNHWRGIDAETAALVAGAMRRDDPAVNTGVFAFHRGYPGLLQWKELCEKGYRCSFTDELAMQLLYPTWSDCVLLDDRFNKSARLGSYHESARIIHCHGRSHLRSDKAWALWQPHCAAALDANAGGLRDWFGSGDSKLKERWDSV